jgi:GT2 family glycosyltransferase
VSAQVLVSIVTHNHAHYLEECLQSLHSQAFGNLEVHLWDNASSDGSLDVAARHGELLSEIHASSRNLGFCAAHNRIIAAADSEYALVLNPDVVLNEGFIATIVEALERDPRSGSATGKLWRHSAGPPGAPKILDTTGIFFTRNQRHLDRGAGSRDQGQYDRREYVFGPSGAAAFYRRKMLEEVRMWGEYFDETFFAYREDADLAWRSQWLGWRCLYVPEATGYHVRRVLPERRASLPPEINMHSLKNRFLLRVKNMDAGTYARNFLPITARDLLALGYVALRERSSLRAFPLVIKALPGAWAARRALIRHRRVSPREIRSWFSNTPVSRPFDL